MLNFAQFSATMALNATIEEVKGEVDPGARRPAAELGRRPQLGLDRGALADEGGGQGRRRAARARSRARPPPACCGRSRGPSAAGASSTSGSIRIAGSSATRRSGRTSSSTRPGARTRRRSSRPIRGYLETDYDYPATLAAVKDDLEAARPSFWTASRTGEAREQLRARPRPLAADEPAHARPPLLHRPGHERARPARPRRDRPAARRGGCARRPRGRDVPALQRAARADRRSARHSTRRRSSATGGTSASGSFAVRPPEWIGTATESQLAFPYYTLWGFPEKFHRKPAERPTRSTALPPRRGSVEGIGAPRRARSTSSTRCRTARSSSAR